MIVFMRELGSDFRRCESTDCSHRPIKVERASKQHAAYVETLREFDCRVELLRAIADQPDGVLIEESAVLLPEVAIIMRPRVLGRSRAIESVATHVAQYRPVQRIRGGHLNGGDALRVGSTIYVARSHTTDIEGIAAFTEIVDQFGYEVRQVEIRDCRHLKTACTFVPPDFLIVNSEWVDLNAFSEFQIIKVHPKEPFAANTLTLSGTTLVGAAFPKSEKKLQAAGIATRKIDVSELQKMEAGLTSFSLLLEPRTRTHPAPRSAVTSIKTPGAPAPLGYETQAIVHGGFVFVSGQLPINPATRRVVRGPIEAQTEQTLNNVVAVLAASESSLARVVKITLYLADRKLLDRVDAVLARVMAGHRPARVVRPTRSLPDGCLLEMEVIAVVAD